MTTFAWELPWPPVTTNSLYITRPPFWYKGRLVTQAKALAPTAREWKNGVTLLVRTAQVRVPREGSLAVQLDAYPPSTARGDLDNLLKLTLDAVCRGLGVDDRRIVDLRIVRHEATTAPRLCVQIEWIGKPE